MLNPTQMPVPTQKRRAARSIVVSSYWIFEHWIAVFSILFGVFVLTPFLAPIFMRLGWTGFGQSIYLAYSALCHQLAQRSFFLFGSQPMYNIAQLPVPITTNEAVNLLALRDFVGNASLGWKVAWSDRMVYMFGATWIAGMIYGLVRQRWVISPLRIPLFAALLMPMLIDGVTHFLSDLSVGLAGGFRYNNEWLADLTGRVLPNWFYVGDTFGSFNSWMRLLSGVCFGIAVVWLTFPYMERSFREAAAALSMKLAAHPAE